MLLVSKTLGPVRIRYEINHRPKTFHIRQPEIIHVMDGYGKLDTTMCMPKDIFYGSNTEFFLDPEIPVTTIHVTRLDVNNPNTARIHTTMNNKCYRLFNNTKNAICIVLNPIKHQELDSLLLCHEKINNIRHNVHSHNNSWELFIITKGIGMAYLDGDEFPITTGDSILFPAKTPHSISAIEPIEALVMMCNQDAISLARSVEKFK